MKLKETFCAYVAPKKAAAKAPTPSAPASVGIVTLHVHLDPSFVQSPANPLAVTYSYSASATEAVNGVTNPISDLPSGILNLYSDGLLKCSISVGGPTTGGEYPVTYRPRAHTRSSPTIRQGRSVQPKRASSTSLRSRRRPPPPTGLGRSATGSVSMNGRRWKWSQSWSLRTEAPSPSSEKSRLPT